MGAAAGGAGVTSWGGACWSDVVWVGDRGGPPNVDMKESTVEARDGISGLHEHEAILGAEVHTSRASHGGKLGGPWSLYYGKEKSETAGASDRETTQQRSCLKGCGSLLWVRISGPKLSKRRTGSCNSRSQAEEQRWRWMSKTEKAKIKSKTGKRDRPTQAAVGSRA